MPTDDFPNNRSENSDSELPHPRENLEGQEWLQASEGQVSTFFDVLKSLDQLLVLIQVHMHNISHIILGGMIIASVA